MSGNAKLQEKRSTLISETARERIRSNTRTVEKTEDNIKNNPFYKILIDGSQTPVERKNAFAQFMTATLDKATDRERIKQYEDFREWLSHQNTALAQQIIELTNTGTFSTLQVVIDKMNSGLLDINRKMDPLNELLESIHLLNMEDKMFDAYAEIEKEEELRAAREKEVADLEAKLQAEREAANRLDGDTAALAQKRGFFGFGGIPAATKEQIARNEVEIERKRKEAEQLAHDLEALKSKPINPESNLDQDMQVHKERMRQFLNLSNGQTVEQMQDLVNATLSYVNEAKVNSSKIREEFGDLSERLDKADDNNRRFVSVYGIMTEGLKDAAKSNVGKREELTGKLETAGDDVLVKMEVEDNLRSLDSHSKLLLNAQGETTTSFSNLSKQSMRVGAMKDATAQQIDVARNLNTEGVSTTADQLASVITAISGAAITESANVVEANLRRMGEKSNDILQKEVMRNAAYVDKINTKMGYIFGELQEFHETQKIASEVIRDGLSAMNKNMADLDAQTKALQEEMANTLALNSEFVHGEGEGTTTTVETNNNGFNW